MDTIELEDRLDPILIWRVNGVPSDLAVEYFLDAHARFAARGERHLVVIDARFAAPPSREQLRRIAERSHDLADSMLGIALVVPSQSLRRALMQMRSWRALPAPHVLCPHMAAAMLWAEGQLLRAAA